MKSKNSILVVGAGFVGLATATFFARKGHFVTVAEINPNTIDPLNRGELHFHEPKLATEFRKAVKAGKLVVKQPTEEDYTGSRFVIIAIDSVDQRNWTMKSDAFEQMADWIGSKRYSPRHTVFLKSTNILGFSKFFRGCLDATPYGKEVELIVNPEFLAEGTAYEDTAEPSRVVIGTLDGKSGGAGEKLVRSLYPKAVPFINTTWKGAELIKLGSNLYLSHRLTFINELAEYARSINLDIPTICEGIGLDPRIGTHYFKPGLGFGGSCLPKDCRLINSEELEPKFDFQVAYTALLVNDDILESIVSRLKDRLGNLKGKKIALLGVAFKPEADDVRGSQVLKLAQKLKRRGARLSIYDPFVDGIDSPVDGKWDTESSWKDALKSANAVVVGTAHSAFKKITPAAASKLVRRKLVIDNYGHLNFKSWTKAGFKFA